MIRPYPSVETRDLSRLWNSGSSEKFVGNFLGSLALYSSVHTGMTNVVLSVIFVETTPVIPPGIGGIQEPGMATKFGFGYVSKYLVDLWTSPSDRPSSCGTCGQPGQTTLRVAHRLTTLSGLSPTGATRATTTK